MMHSPVVREIPGKGHNTPVARDSFIDGLTPSELHAKLRCETVRPPVVVAPDVWISLDDRML